MTPPTSIGRQLGYQPFLKFMQMEPDLVSLLNTSASASYKTAVATNRTDTMARVLTDNGIDHLFDLVVCALDVQVPQAPSRRPSIKWPTTLQCIAQQKSCISVIPKSTKRRPVAAGTCLSWPIETRRLPPITISSTLSEIADLLDCYMVRRRKKSMRHHPPPSHAIWFTWYGHCMATFGRKPKS